MIDDFESIEVESDDREVMVSLDYEGEGWGGDYDPDDPDDEPLCRFALFRKYHDSDQLPEYFVEGDAYEDGDWMAVIDGSYCTQLLATSSPAALRQAAEFILSRVEDGIRSKRRQKRLYEALSWIRLENGQPTCDVDC